MNLETTHFNYSGPYEVAGTPFALARAGVGIGSIILRDGKEDVGVSERFRIAFRNVSLSHPGVPMRMAVWLRQVHADEQSKKLVFEASALDAYHGHVPALRDFAGDLIASTKLRVTVEEIR
jgi:hypothetical protein